MRLRPRARLWDGRELRRGRGGDGVVFLLHGTGGSVTDISSESVTSPLLSEFPHPLSSCYRWL